MDVESISWYSAVDRATGEVMCPGPDDTLIPHCASSEGLLPEFLTRKWTVGHLPSKWIWITPLWQALSYGSSGLICAGLLSLSQGSAGWDLTLLLLTMTPHTQKCKTHGKLNICEQTWSKWENSFSGPRAVTDISHSGAGLSLIMLLNLCLCSLVPDTNTETVLGEVGKSSCYCFARRRGHTSLVPWRLWSTLGGSRGPV